MVEGIGFKVFTLHLLPFTLNLLSMLRNYLTVAFRNLWKRKAQTFINVLGLSLGVASAIIIFLIVRYEFSFDRFHEKADRVYRVVTAYHANDGNTYNNAGGARPLPNALRNDFGDDLEAVTPIERYYGGHGRVQADSQTVFVDGTIVYTESSYFSLFDFPLLTGDRATVLTQPNEVVISRELSEKLFDQPKGAIGQIINLDDQHQLNVVGVLADYPKNTGFNFSMLVSFYTQPRDRDEDSAWDHYNSSFQTYVLLPPHVGDTSINARFPEFVDKYQGEEDKKYGNRDMYLQSLSDIHLESQFGDFPFRKTSQNVLGGMTAIAVLLILLACINFVNLATAVSRQRSKEIGIRKVVGSSRAQVMTYFLGEALFVTLIAMGLALGLTELGLIHLRKLYPFLEAVQTTLDIGLITFLIMVVLVVAILAGFYPALILSRFRPVHMFNRSWATPRKHAFSVRQVLVIFQFFISQVFILGVLIVGQQLNYLLEAPLGFNEEAVLIVDFPDEDAQIQRRFKEALQNHSGVEHASLSMFTAMSRAMSATSFGYDGEDKDESEKYTYLQMADANYFSTYEIAFLAGGNYTPADSGSGFVVNEAFLEEAGVASPEEAIGKYVAMNDLELPITGVVADYHTGTFHYDIPPLLITNYSADYQRLNVKVTISQAEAVIEQLQTLWLDNYPDFPFNYRFLDDAIAGFYKEYQRLLSLTQLFSGIAIAIGCLGLYGLVLFMAEQRTPKEIGIRKVLGASVKQLLALFSGEFIKLVLIAFGLAAPLAYLLMQQWLENFVYRIDIGVTVFISCLLVTLLLVIATVSYRSTRAALANPVDSLRDE